MRNSECGMDDRASIPHSTFHIPYSNDRHRIAIAVEPIPLLNGFPVRPHHVLIARERAHQHEQRRARQVEVREQPVHRTERVRGMNEQPGLPGAWADLATLAGERLERAHDGRPDRPDPTSCLPSLIDYAG